MIEQNPPIKYNSTQELLAKMADALAEHGIHISCPWDGTLDDLEQERFEGLVALLDVAESADAKNWRQVADRLTTACKSALAFIEEEADNRAAAGSECSDYEREPRELAKELSAAIASSEGR